MVKMRGSYDPIVFRAERVGCKEVISFKKPHFNYHKNKGVLTMSVIDDIVEMILKEARRRATYNYPYRIQEVMMDVNKGVLDVLDVLRDEERRKKEDENKG